MKKNDASPLECIAPIDKTHVIPEVPNETENYIESLVGLVKDGVRLPVLPLPQGVFFPRVKVGVLFPAIEGVVPLLEEVKKNIDRHPPFVLFAGLQPSVRGMRQTKLSDFKARDYLSSALVCVIEGVREAEEGLAMLLDVVSRVQLKAFGRKRHDYARATFDLLPYKEDLERGPLPWLQSDPVQTPIKWLFQDFWGKAAEMVELSWKTHYEEKFLREIMHPEQGRSLIAFVASMIEISYEKKYHLLTLDSYRDLMFHLSVQLTTQKEILGIKADIEQEVEKVQREMNRRKVLQMQLKAIQAELGEVEESDTKEGSQDSLFSELQAKGQAMRCPEAQREHFERELRNLSRLHPHSPDYAILAQYLQLFVSLPWGIYSEDSFDLKETERILERDHFGLETVKERILEHLAMLKLKQGLKSPIICLYGPPGVGKTSLGKSVAEGLGRKYLRIALGGVHEESEIRGHRRTYIGAMAGRIIDGLKRAGTSNPVFVLDEIDKLSDGLRGDPAAALLEVLDPEQNKAFHDNYLDVDYDLSQVLFIATANNLNDISRPLLDRMELIPVSGYLVEEKVEIAQRYLIPKVLEEHGLTQEHFTMDQDTLVYLIEYYTRESGVRTLQKRLAALVRKQAKQVAFDQEIDPVITPERILDWLKTPPYSRDVWQNFGIPGVVTGLAWTAVGGEILFVESSTHRGKTGVIQLTGSLGDVMKESALVALDYIKSHADVLEIAPEIFTDLEVHLHVPEGATPKDGPSAGITIATSLVSTLTRRFVRPRIAMTGEISLTGRVLPVGGVKEKILAAKRAGVETIILSRENEKDINDIKAVYVEGLQFHYVDTILEVLDLALEPRK